MSLQDVLIWSCVVIFVIVPAVALARWRVIAARKLTNRIVSDLKASGEQLPEQDRKAIVAQLMVSGWKTRMLTVKVQGPRIPDIYLVEWATIDRRVKRLRLVGIMAGVVILIALKTLIREQ
jgi:hypothetical protein